MYTYVYMYLSLSLYLSLCIYIYIYIYVYTLVWGGHLGHEGITSMIVHISMRIIQY